MPPAVYFTILNGIERQRQRLVVKNVILQCIKFVSEQPNNNFEIAAEPSGRPIVVGRPDIFVSVSHTKTSLACAASMAGPMGIDLETARAGRAFDAMAAFAFGPAEVYRAAEEGPGGFYRIWTLREAISKAEGLGLAQVTDRQDRVDTGPAIGNWRWQDWHLTHRIPSRGMHVALAVRAPQIETIEWCFLPDEHATQ